MKPFLYYVAKDLIGKFGNNLSDVTIVFPGKRAELYMNTFLSHFAQGPVWAPRFKTIDELFQQLSDLTPSDPIINVCRLYRIYAELVPNPESLDDFYGWGEILMNDFGDIDKHMVDADRLFANATDLAKMDNVDYLSESQINALRQFFANFDPQHQTDIKRRFLEIWQVMPQMYKRLKEDLRKDGLMYKGALYREVADGKSLPFKGTSGGVFCFVGFNVLDEVEEALFSALRDAGKALFYWDYDVYYTEREKDHEAGHFLRHNLRHYPNELPEDIFDNLVGKEKKIRFISTSTDNAQVRYLPQWIGEKLTMPEHESGVILCDEALMRPALHALPGATANITMGYPITDTAVYGYLSALIDLQVDGYEPDLRRFRPTLLERLKKNPFYATFPQAMLPITHKENILDLIDWLIAAIEAVGKNYQSSIINYQLSNVIPLYTEATYQLHRILGQMRWLVSEGTLNVKDTTLRRLMRQAMATASIPFHGEMDEGLQVMGVLEARNLDFRHLIMLSVGEGIIPRRSSDTSLIPYILRAHFGLDTTERQDSVYAYSFYRLLQRAEDVTLVYNSNSSGVSQREQSRFLRQLETETNLYIEHITDTQTTALNPTAPIQVRKNERVMDILRQKKMMSPTAINQYIDCPLKFYYQQVARLRMPDRPQDGIDNAHFGTLFHDTCEIFYQRLCQSTGRKEVRHSDLAPLVADPKGLGQFVDQAFERMMEGSSRNYTGVNMIIRDVILQLLVQLLRWDMEHTPFTLYGMEEDRYLTLTIGEQRVTIGGRIDRMDIMQIDGRPTLRVVDYKTGRAKTGPGSIEGIFDGNAHNAHGYYLQTFLYSLIVKNDNANDNTNGSLPVSPCLFYVLSATDAKGYNPMLRLGKETVSDIADYADEYLEGLTRVLGEIFDPERPFVQTNDEKTHCQYCDFRLLCNK